MPGMRVFGRRCALATDDFFFIGALDSIIFLPWLAYVPVIYASYWNSRNNCDILNPLIEILLPALCALFLINWIIGALFVIFSVKGTVVEPEPRRHVVTLVYIKLIISILDLGCAVLCTYILVEDTYCKILGLPLLIKLSVIFLWIATVVRIGLIIVCYDWRFSEKSKTRLEKEYFTSAVRTGTMRRWNLRLQAMFLWCTTPSEARKEAIKTASELMALLSCDLDLVVSDVVAGMLLYRQKCLSNWEAEKAALDCSPYISETEGGTSISQFPPVSIPPWMNFQLAKRYFDIGLGVFGWPWYIYRNFLCGCCHLMRRLICCFSCRSTYKSTVFGDNCCGCNLVGLQATSGVIYEDLVHVSFVDKVFEVPFFITYDHETKAVLVTARGTMSVNDVLTDISAGYADMDDPGLPEKSLCHHGMLKAAREMKRKILEEGILERALSKHRDYNLVITGHSLGASVASILTLLLKAEYPKVRCFAFAPAPTVSQTVLEYSRDNVFTLIYGNDSVPYLNYENVKDMVIEMVKCLQECGISKYKIFMNYKRKNDSSREISNENTNGQTNGCKTDKIPTFKNSTSCVENGVKMPSVTESLYVSGRILHIRKAEDGYRLKLTSPEEYRPLAFRPNMILHHFPQMMQKCLHYLGKTAVLDATSVLYPVK